MSAAPPQGIDSVPTCCGFIPASSCPHHRHRPTPVLDLDALARETAEKVGALIGYALGTHSRAVAIIRAALDRVREEK